MRKEEKKRPREVENVSWGASGAALWVVPCDDEVQKM
jgi:hypothetical protein